MAILLAALTLSSVHSASAATTIHVTSGADSGPGTLRQALLDAQVCAGAPTTIEFNLAPSSLTTQSGVTFANIVVLTPLPAITCETSILGATQPLTSPNPAHEHAYGGPVGLGPDAREGTPDDPQMTALTAPSVQIDARSIPATSPVFDIRSANVAIESLAILGGLRSVDVPLGTDAAGLRLVDNVFGWPSAPTPGYPASTAELQANAASIQGNAAGLAFQGNVAHSFRSVPEGTGGGTVVVRFGALTGLGPSAYPGAQFVGNTFSGCFGSAGGFCMGMSPPSGSHITDLTGLHIQRNYFGGDAGMGITLPVTSSGCCVGMEIRDNTFDRVGLPMLLNHWPLTSAGGNNHVTVAHNIVRNSGWLWKTGIDNQYRAGSGVTTSRNSTYNNDGLAIDTIRLDDELDSNGGDNNRGLDYPVVSKIWGSPIDRVQLIEDSAGQHLRIIGYAQAGATVELYDADINHGAAVSPENNFAARVNSAIQPLGFGEGQQYLTSFLVPMGTPTTVTYDGTTTPQAGGYASNEFDVTVTLPSWFEAEADTVFAWTILGTNPAGNPSHSEFGTNFRATQLLTSSSNPTTTFNRASRTATLSYDVSVTNKNALPRQYDLNDTIALPPGHTLDSLSVVLVDGGPDTPTVSNLASGETLTIAAAQNVSGGATHTYRVTATYAIANSISTHEVAVTTCAQAADGSFIPGGGLQHRVEAEFATTFQYPSTGCSPSPVRTAMVSGVVYADADGNSKWGPSELAAPGSLVSLLGDTDGDGDSETLEVAASNGSTDIDGDGSIDPAGSYWFPLLADGTYIITTVLPSALGAQSTTTTLVLGAGEVRLVDIGGALPASTSPTTTAPAPVRTPPTSVLDSSGAAADSSASRGPSEGGALAFTGTTVAGAFAGSAIAIALGWLLLGARRRRVANRYSDPYR